MVSSTGWELKSYSYHPKKGSRVSSLRCLRIATTTAEKTPARAPTLAPTLAATLRHSVSTTTIWSFSMRMINPKKRFPTISFYFGMCMQSFSLSLIPSQWELHNRSPLQYWFFSHLLLSLYFIESHTIFFPLSSRYVLPSTGTWIEQPQEWAQCELCHKWRKLAQGVYASTLPDVWTCSQNSRSLWVWRNVL